MEGRGRPAEAPDQAVGIEAPKLKPQKLKFPSTSCLLGHSDVRVRKWDRARGKRRKAEKATQPWARATAGGRDPRAAGISWNGGCQEAKGSDETGMGTL